MNSASIKKIPSQTILILIIIAAGFITYSFMFGGTFKTLDDYSMIVNNPNVKDFFQLKNIFTSSYFGLGSYYRPMLQFSYLVDYQIFGPDPFFFYLTNILYHLIITAFVFLLLKEFFDEPAIPFFVALLFAIHPLHWITVSTITSRSSSVLGLFFITSVYFFVRYKKEKGSRITYIFSLVCFIFALLSRETAVMIPVILLSYLYFCSSENFKMFLRDARITVPYFILIAFYILLRQSLGIVKLFNERTLVEVTLGFLTFLRALITHLRIFIFPHDLHFDRTRILFQDFKDPQIFATIIFFGLVATVLIYFKKNIDKRALFFLSWFIIILFPVSQLPAATLIQPGIITTGEHHLYLPSIGILTLIVICLYRLYEKNVLSKSIFKFSVLSLIIVLISITIKQVTLTKSEFNLHKQTLFYEPLNIRIRNSYISALIREGMFIELEEQYREILQMNSQLVSARIGLGKALIDQGNIQAGIKEYEKVTDPGQYDTLLRENMRLAKQLLIQQSGGALFNE